MVLSSYTTHYKKWIIIFATLMSGCSSNPPKVSHDNICSLFEHDSDWEEAAYDAQKKWGTPAYISMAFVHQESRFSHDAKPERDYFLGIIPLPRRSSSYGYSQAQDPVWYDYQKDTGNWSARRNNIDDSMDFIGWYNNQSHKRNGISRNDTYNLYLAYHEGQGGFARKTYNNKPWLKKVAYKVTQRSIRYKKQLQQCGHSRYSPPVSSPKNKGNCNAPWPFC
ncbi:MAG: hypothetical protein CO158_03100 [Piscirickettsiaceae bacterium CG_4_9_14_3_um_filter_43_564]|nr:hypothetical protein [Thiomicrospira sp.]OIP94587.1 MAG: hypothetical protein AUK56_08185 [Thiomicrospira sp. CG2_30_44_34]PIQ03586.1 MAG: hypothetical protein COW74_07290 [Piscirickettsiaceae bacterium CG18_big_fil_WC_8_21_14_2_50_44_103]PIU38107.1 MAG: hypothetical protein COT01_08705 [Piscirickettsiaceae bacterium CG07_land_8_20_14_0_80_44_28]PIW56684.1 MAG: hypothetical protein COW14_10530 [Piscirickettsiaceae bacterium CG12_big_fil_rev_8_21_14_0_65_44_934]PIW77292.1 MAG: hypothetical p